MKDELGGNIVKKFVGLKVNTQSYLRDDNDERKKKAKGTKKCVIKRKPKFEDYKICLEPTHLENKIIYLNNNKIDVKKSSRKSQKIFGKQNNINTTTTTLKQKA